MSLVKTTEIKALNFTERWNCYAQLFKLKLTSFVVISAIFGYLIGASAYNLSQLLFLVVGGFLVTASANAFNQVIEKNHDRLMERTKNRPLPSNKLAVSEAFLLAVGFGLIGVSILWLGLNPLSGILGALAIFMYAAIYTPLKRVSTISVFVGAFPGAIPPMLGWVAATGSFSLEAGILFALQFLWQFPHFWAIAWRINGDYTKAGFKMLPYGKKDKRTAVIILLSSIALMLGSFMPEYFGITSNIATYGLIALSFLLVYPAIKLVQTLDDKFALRVMLMSYLYLILSLVLLFIDKI